MMKTTALCVAIVLVIGILMGCSLSSPLTGGATAKIPSENSSLSSGESHVRSVGVSARVFVSPLQSP